MFPKCCLIFLNSCPPTLSGVWDALSRPLHGLSGGVRGGDMGPKTCPELYRRGGSLIAWGRLGPVLASSKTSSIFAHWLEPILGYF